MWDLPHTRSRLSDKRNPNPSDDALHSLLFSCGLIVYGTHIISFLLVQNIALSTAKPNLGRGPGLPGANDQKEEVEQISAK